MSTTLKEVIEAGDYDLDSYDDAQWLLSRRSEFEDLIEQAEELIERIDEEREHHENT